MTDHIKAVDPEIHASLQQELARQKETINLIASENYVSQAILEALGSIATNKYSEGYPTKRYYGGNKNIDEIETLAIERAKKLFKAEHANVQPHSGAPANIAVYNALLQPGDTILAMHLNYGGHLTHGSTVTAVSKLYNFVRYTANKETGAINYKEIEKIAKKEKPKLILVGYSAYSKEIDYQKFKAIADKVGAYTMADIAHIAGLIVAEKMHNPVPLFDVVTTTTHKTLRGPRGGLILCKEKIAKQIDKAVFPGFQGGPHEQTIAAKAICFKEAQQEEFKTYAEQILKNAKTLCEELKKYNFTIVFGSTENNLLLINLENKQTTGKEAEEALEKVGIIVNKNMVPEDKRKPLDPSGIRIGTPAVTTRGMQEEDMKEIAKMINETIEHRENEEKLAEIKKEVTTLVQKFPIYEGVEY